MKKLALAGISLLAVGLLILGPQANVVGYQTQQNSKDVVLQVEVTGLSSKKTVKISEDQYQQLRTYLKEFQARLNASSSLDETKSLFKEALVRFKAFGLLPGINIEKLYTRICRTLPKHTIPPKRASNVKDVVNHFCLVYGTGTNVLYQNVILDLLCVFFMFELLSQFTSVFFAILPFSLEQVVSMGGYGGVDGEYGSSPSTGYIYTNGMNGKITDSGDLWGTLRVPWFVAGGQVCAPAVFGFTGIKLMPNVEENVFIGSALAVSYNVTY